MQQLPAPVHEPPEPQLQRVTASQVRRIFDRDLREDRVHSAVNQAIHGQYWCSIVFV